MCHRTLCLDKRDVIKALGVVKIDWVNKRRISSHWPDPLPNASLDARHLSEALGKGAGQ